MNRPPPPPPMAIAPMLMSAPPRRYAALAPAMPRAPEPPPPRVTFYDLPAELRIEIYKLTLKDVTVHVLPLGSGDETRQAPHPHSLTLASKQVRNEVLPIIHSMCPIVCAVTDFVFDGLLLWLQRIPPDEQSKLCKNENLKIRFHTTQNQASRALDSLRKWLRIRSDTCRPQPNWQYGGATPPSKVCADLRRRTKRMKEVGKQSEMLAILKALNISCEPDTRSSSSRRNGP